MRAFVFIVVVLFSLKAHSQTIDIKLSGDNSCNVEVVLITPEPFTWQDITGSSFETFQSFGNYPNGGQFLYYPNAGGDYPLGPGSGCCWSATELPSIGYFKTPAGTPINGAIAYDGQFWARLVASDDYPFTPFDPGSHTPVSNFNRIINIVDIPVLPNTQYYVRYAHASDTLMPAPIFDPAGETVLSIQSANYATPFYIDFRDQAPGHYQWEVVEHSFTTDATTTAIWIGLGGYTEPPLLQGNIVLDKVQFASDPGFIEDIQYSFQLADVRWETNYTFGYTNQLKIWDDERSYTYKGQGADLPAQQADVFAKLDQIKAWKLNCQAVKE